MGTYINDLDEMVLNMKKIPVTLAILLTFTLTSYLAYADEELEKSRSRALDGWTKNTEGDYGYLLTRPYSYKINLHISDPAKKAKIIAENKAARDAWIKTLPTNEELAKRDHAKEVARVANQVQKLDQSILHSRTRSEKLQIKIASLETRKNELAQKRVELNSELEKISKDTALKNKEDTKVVEKTLKDYRNVLREQGEVVDDLVEIRNDAELERSKYMIMSQDLVKEQDQLRIISGEVVPAPKLQVSKAKPTAKASVAAASSPEVKILKATPVEEEGEPEQAEQDKAVRASVADTQIEAQQERQEALNHSQSALLLMSDIDQLKAEAKNDLSKTDLLIKSLEEQYQKSLLGKMVKEEIEQAKKSAVAEACSAAKTCSNSNILNILDTARSSQDKKTSAPAAKPAELSKDQAK